MLPSDRTHYDSNHWSQAEQYFLFILLIYFIIFFIIDPQYRKPLEEITLNQSYKIIENLAV